MKEDRSANASVDCVRIVIADGHALVRRGLGMLLDLQPDMAVVGQAATGRQALDLALQLEPDVILADEAMQPPDGIELARELRTVLPQTRIVVVSMREDSSTAKAAFAAGALGYVIKRGSESQLLDAIHAVAAGQRYVDPFVEELL